MVPKYRISALTAEYLWVHPNGSVEARLKFKGTNDSPDAAQVLLGVLKLCIADWALILVYTSRISQVITISPLPPAGAQNNSIPSDSE